MTGIKSVGRKVGRKIFRWPKAFPEKMTRGGVVAGKGYREGERVCVCIFMKKISNLGFKYFRGGTKCVKLKVMG